MRNTTARLFAVLALAAMLVAAPAAAADRGDGSRFLLLHLDGIPSSLLQRELEGGRLPNVARLFAAGGRISKALSLWPGGTEMIYPRLKGRSGPAQSLPVSWNSWDRARAKPFGEVNIFFRLAGALPREARYQLVEGFGRGDLTAGLAMQNLPDLLKTRRTVELFWFATDGSGHLAGEKGELKSLWHFDWWLGKATARLDKDVNIVLYCDHGMVFSRNVTSVPAVLRRVIGDQALFYNYPNVYLKDPSTSAETAALLAREPEIPFAFYREAPDRIRGFCKGGTLEFVIEGDRLRYFWEGEGPDPLGYAAAGYRGEALTDEEWLARTADLEMPAVPVQVGRFMQNPYTGDVTVAVNPLLRDWTRPCPESGHQGLTAADLMVSVLFTGPEVAPLRGVDSLWLHTLYRRLPALDLEAQAPAREENRAALFAHPAAAEVTLSPAYRWRMRAAGPLDGAADGSLRAEFDIFRTYLGGVWLGAGTVQGRQGISLGWALDLKAGHVRGGFRAAARPGGGAPEKEWTLGYDLTDALTLEVRSGGQYGLAWRW